VDDIDIRIVGKYVHLRDAYLSVIEALKHGGFEHGARVNLTWIASDELISGGAQEALSGADGILVPGGFGIRGVEGKIEAIRFAREQEIPFLGLCLGLQCAVIEFARNVCGLSQANSSEFAPDTPDPVIDLLPEQQDVVDLGGSMRLGAYPCHLLEGTRAARAYGEPVVYERHRHRYEVNAAYHRVLKEHGLVFSGLSPDGRLVEIIELADHPFFVAGQFHPELKSRPTRPHPLFREFVGAARSRRHAAATAGVTG
jgi:CTP synthase